MSKEERLLERIAELEAMVERLSAQLKKLRVSGKELGDYEVRLRELVRERRGRIDGFVEPQISVAAQAWRRLNKLEEEAELSVTIVREVGSMGQQKAMLNPIYTALKVYHPIARQHFQALGLNYDTLPSKVAEAGVLKEDDALSSFLKYQK